MCQIILLIASIVYAFRIPRLLKARPGSTDNPDIFWQWRAKELASIYWFIGAMWGAFFVTMIIGVIIVVVTLGNGGKADDVATPITFLFWVLCLGPLIYAGILGSQAAKLKKQLGTYALPPSYYPRAGQQLIQAPPSEVPPAYAQPDPATPEIVGDMPPQPAEPGREEPWQEPAATHPQPVEESESGPSPDDRS